MKKIGIIGAGNMGAGIAQKTAQEGLSVVMVDIKPEFVEKGLNTIKSTLKEAVDRKIIKPEQADEIVGRIHGTTDKNEVKDCDLVIEAIFEDLKVKQDLFAELDKICDPKTIFGTNTSSLSVDEISQGTKRQDRVIGLHFFYHPAKNRLLEIIPGPKTSADTVAACKEYSQLTGKTDIIVKDAGGFAVNRFFVPWLNEATRLLEEGIANIATIEKAAKETFNIGMGPFELMNVTGIPIACHATSGLADAFGPFYATSEILKAQNQKNEFWPLDGDVDESKFEQVADRLLGVIFYVATALYEEGVADMTDTDLGAKVGLRWRIGPFELLNRIGVEKAYNQVKNLLKAWPDYKIPGVLEAQYKAGKPFDLRYVKYTKDGEIGRVMISRPDAMNALNETIVKQIDEAFTKAESDPDTKAIIIETAGKAFVAGADIKFFVDCIKENRLDRNYDFTAYGQDVLNRIDDSKKLIIAKMDGLALGGGFELALSTDVIVATPKAVMGFPETGIGIYPGLGGTQRTSRFIGKELAKYIIFTGRVISAKDANAIGLVDYVFAPDEIEGKIKSLIAEGKLTPNKGKDDGSLPEDFRRLKELFADKNIESWLSGKYLDDSDPLAAKTAKILASKAPLALKFANNIIDTGFEKPLKEGLKVELAHLNEIFSTKDALTGLTSVGKAAPKYEGK